MILLGLDPAFRENGFAVAMYDPTDLFEPLRFVIFRNVGCFVGWLVNDAPVLAFACVENSNLDPAVYHLSPKMNVRTAAAVGIRVGKNQAISQLAVDLLRNRYSKHNVLEVSPSKKGGKVYPARVAAVDVIDLTGKNPSAVVLEALKSEDCRSALMMLMRAHKQYRLKQMIYDVSLH
jgi:hypothetical protein